MKVTFSMASKFVRSALPTVALVYGVSLAGVCFSQARGTTTQSMFGTSQVGNPAGASGAGTGTGMTMGQGQQNGNANTPNSGAATGNSLGLGANMQNFTPGGSTGFVGANAQSAT